MQFLSREKAHFVEPDWVRQMRRCHTIETKKYAEFCFKVFEQMVFPVPKRKIYKEYWKRDYQTTLDCYRNIFGSKPPRLIWQRVKEEYRVLVNHEFKFYDLSSYTFSELRKEEEGPRLKEKDRRVLAVLQ